MAVNVALDPAEQARRRKRARLSQQAVGAQFETPVSITSISDYERGKLRLPFGFTPEDYEIALSRALLAKHEASA